MKKLLKTTIMLSSLVSFMLILTACPNTEKIDELIQISEQEEITKKYVSVFNESGNSKFSHLYFWCVYGDQATGSRTIDLMREGGRSDADWVLHLLVFQEILDRDQLFYTNIRVFDESRKAETYLFERDNLIAYRKVYKLFKKNLESIRSGTFSDLKPVLDAGLTVETVEELLRFAPIKSYNEFTLVNYGDSVESNSYVTSLNCVTFKIGTKSGSWLYFNYSSEKEVHLTSIDLKKK